MDEKEKELERIQKALLAEDEETGSDLDEILDDEELTALLSPKPQPAFEDPDEIHDPPEGKQVRNFANDYGNRDQRKAEARQHDKLVIGLMLAVCGLCLGIIGILAYWLGVLL